VEVLTLAFSFVLGAILASFGGVIAGRIGTGQSWSTGRSRCDACGTDLPAFALVPILSALMRRACRACGVRATAWYALQEAVLGALFALGAWRFGLTPQLAVFFALLFVLYVLVLYDLRHTIVPPVLSALLAVLCLALAILESPSWHALGVAFVIAAVIGLAFVALHALSRGRAMGLGDAPVAFALSLAAAPLAPAGLAFSFWIGAAVGIVIVASRPRGRRMGIEVPFVPFLAAGYLLAILTQWNPFPW
jgi:prepilin signal peptidase PulO-like enzyme (type II secretory pathway)